jgi:hypothetical protein
MAGATLYDRSIQFELIFIGSKKQIERKARPADSRSGNGEHKSVVAPSDESKRSRNGCPKLRASCRDKSRNAFTAENR